MENKTVGFIGGKFLPLHNGHLYAIAYAAKQVDELYVILTSSINRDRELCDRDGCKYMPGTIRGSWVGRACISLGKNIKFIHIRDFEYEDDYDWEEGANQIKKAIGKKIDFVFSSEPSYNKHFSKDYPEAKHIVIDSERQACNISATQIRKDVYKYWNFLPYFVKGFFAKKILITGTESCGKTTMVKKLAKHYNTSYVREVGRDYCEKYNNQLTADMFDKIAMEHYLLHDKSECYNKISFIDSDAVITQYYRDMYISEEKYQSKIIDAIIAKQNFDLILYLEPDVLWVADGYRFAGDNKVRRVLNDKLKNMYFKWGYNLTFIHGNNYDQRFEQAKAWVDGIIENMS